MACSLGVSPTGAQRFLHWRGSKFSHSLMIYALLSFSRIRDSKGTRLTVKEVPKINTPKLERQSRRRKNEAKINRENGTTRRKKKRESVCM